MSKSLLSLLFILPFITFSPKVFGQIIINSKTSLSLNEQTLKLAETGSYIFNPKTAYPSIFSLKNEEEEWEVYWEAGKKLEIEIIADSLSFSGDLIAENQYLFSEKQVNDEVSAYLGKNWYVLHKQGAEDYVNTIDSIKSLYTDKMAQAASLSQTFKALNAAAIHFSFDRMLLRYPQFHKNFTGQSVSVSTNSTQKSQQAIDNPAYAGLSTYEKYVRTWLDLEVEQRMEGNHSAQIYRGLQRTNTVLAIISQTFSNQYLKDYWSWEYVKAHIDQHTWINGKALVERLERAIQSTVVKDSLLVYKEKKLQEREELETFVFKTVKGQKLEAYIYKPKNFSPNKTYAALTAFHGGGWVVGDASFTIESAKHAADHGLIGFSVEYRLSNRDDISPADAMEDSRDFIRWVREHADSLSIDPDRILAKGLSAGGHLVSSIAVNQEDPASVPNAMILISPAIDTEDGYFRSLLKEGENHEELSALGNLTAGLKMPKSLLLQGRTDNLTPTKYAQEFSGKMRELGYECELVIYENCGHLFTPSHLDDTAWPQSDPEIVKRAFEKQAEFYKELGYAED